MSTSLVYAGITFREPLLTISYRKEPVYQGPNYLHTKHRWCPTRVATLPADL